MKKMLLVVFIVIIATIINANAADKGKTHAMPSGLKYIDLEVGKGDTPKNGEKDGMKAWQL